MYRLYTILILIVCITFTSCCKRRVYCKSSALKIAFTGFSRSESRSIMLKRYEKGTNFEKAIDSARLVYSGTTPVVAGKPDTLWFSDYDIVTGTIKDIIWGNDWSIEMLATEDFYWIDAIGDAGHRYEIVKCGENSEGCVNPIAEFAVNGGWHVSNTLYLAEP